MGALFDHWLDTWRGRRPIPPEVLDEIRVEDGLAPVAIDLSGEKFLCPYDDETVETVADATPGLLWTLSRERLTPAGRTCQAHGQE